MLQDVKSAAEDYKPSTFRTLEILPRDAEQKPLGHADVATTMIYIHVLSIGRRVVRSTWDSLASTAAPQNGR